MKFSEIQEACWKGYRQAGMKKKGDRMVPNCVPVEEGRPTPERNTALSLAKDLQDMIADFEEIRAAGLDSSNTTFISKLKRRIQTAHEQIRNLGYRYDPNQPGLLRPMGAPVSEVKVGPEMTLNDLLYTAAAKAMHQAGLEGQPMDYEEAIKKAAKIYRIPYTPSELPKLLAQRAEIDRKLAMLKQGKQIAKARRKEKLAPTPAGAEEYWKTHALPTDRIKPPAKTLEETEADLAEDLKKWFKEKWVRFGPDGKIRGACARGSSKEGKPKCLPQAKAHALGKKGRASAAAKKRREDPNPERRGPAKNVATKVKEGFEYGNQVQHPKYGAGQVIKVYSNGIITVNFPNYPDPIDKKPGVQSNFAPGDSGYQSLKSIAKEQYTDDDDWYDEQDDRLKDGDYVRDRQDGEYGEIFRMSGDPSERRVRILDRDGKGWYISPERLDPVDPADPDIQRYFGKRRQRDMDEQLDASGGRMYQAKEKFLLRHNGKDIAFFNTAEEAKQAAQEMMRELKGFSSVHRVMREQGLDEKQDACYRKVKSRYKVWPSAYASGALVQCRKKGAANWGNKSKK